MTETGSRAVTKLTSIASEALGSHPNDGYDFLDIYPLSSELLSMLHEKNGFYAFESALHVFPISSRDCMSLQEWNSDSLWRKGYQDLAAGLLFFAEDVFQDQFCLSTSGVVRFDAETGRTEPYAESIEGWARRVLSHYHVDTGWTLASKWQQEKGSLCPGYRLMPKIPFFLGGQYSLDNLWEGEAVEGMRFKASLAIQTRNIPDGQRVRLAVAKPPIRH